MNERLEDILDGIWYELVVMNAMRALTLVHDPNLSSEERGFVENISRSVIENDEETPETQD